MRFVIDEDMPRSVGPALAELGHEVLDVREQDLRGASDEQVLRFAQQREACLITEDLGFGNVLRFPLGSHHGIIVCRFPSTLRSQTVVSEVLRGVSQLTESQLRGALAIVEVGQWRLRPAGAADLD